MKLLITGSTGFVGSLLCPFLRHAGHSVRTLGRGPARGPESWSWDPGQDVLPSEVLENIDAVIHLAGENIADGRWTRPKKERILRSRVESTALLARAVAAMPRPPSTWISASAIGIYGNRGDEWLTEESSVGTGFLAEVCRSWESAVAPLESSGVRCVFLRLGMVLAAQGGAMARMLPAFRWGLGGTLGSGLQQMSWITADDLCRVVQFVLEQGAVRGPLNVVAPSPVRQREFAQCLGQHLRRPTLVPIPSFLLRLLLGEMADETLLASLRVAPRKLVECGFRFNAATLPEAFRSILA